MSIKEIIYYSTNLSNYLLNMEGWITGFGCIVQFRLVLAYSFACRNKRRTVRESFHKALLMSMLLLFAEAAAVIMTDRRFYDYFLIGCLLPAFIMQPAAVIFGTYTANAVYKAFESNFSLKNIDKAGTLLFITCVSVCVFVCLNLKTGHGLSQLSDGMQAAGLGFRIVLLLRAIVGSIAGYYTRIILKGA